MNTAMRLIALVLVAHVAICAWLYFMQDRMIFFPRAQFLEPAGPHVLPTEVVRPDATLRGWIVNPDSPGPLLIYFGGNAEELSPLVHPFAALDATTVLVNYRGYGRSDGRPSARALLDDAAAVVADADRRYGQGRPVILIGRSLGSAIAVNASRGASVQGMVLMSPFLSLEELARHHVAWMVPVTWLLRHHMETRDFIPALPERMLVLYGVTDSIIPPAFSEAFVGELKHTPDVVRFQGGHNVDLRHPDIWPALEAFLKTVDSAPSTG